MLRFFRPRRNEFVTTASSFAKPYRTMNPVRFTTRHDVFDDLRHRLNHVLIFCGTIRRLLGMSNVDGNAVANDAKELMGLCRAGRLYEIEKWIADGRSLDISEAIKRGRHRSLLEIAVETGFHSLVELIAKHETSQSAKAAASRDAVSSCRLVSCLR
jgi:hypothetical protein